MIKKQNIHSEVFNALKVGGIVEGTVIEKKNRALFVDLDVLGVGVVRGQEFLTAKDIIKNLKPGDSVSGKISQSEDENGFIELSLRDISKEKNWLALKEISSRGEAVNVKITDANAGGLMGEISGIKGFLPASQLSSQHYPKVEGGAKDKILEELKKLIGQELQVKVLDVDPLTQKLIFSEKSVEYGEMKKLISKYKVGDIVDCAVTKVINFGAFVKFGDPPLDGLIHISEFDYKLITDPTSFLKENEQVKAQIISLDNNRISLSLKTLKPDPWDEIEKQYLINESYPGKVSQKGGFGFLVELAPEVIGILKKTPELKEDLEIGKTYKFKVISLDRKSRHIVLELT